MALGRTDFPVERRVEKEEVLARPEPDEQGRSEGRKSREEEEKRRRSTGVQGRTSKGGAEGERAGECEEENEGEEEGPSPSQQE